MLKKIKKDNIVVGDEIVKERKRLKGFVAAREETEGLPEVLDYILQKKKCTSLRRPLKTGSARLK